MLLKVPCFVRPKLYGQLDSGDWGDQDHCKYLGKKGNIACSIKRNNKFKLNEAFCNNQPCKDGLENQFFFFWKLLQSA
jgi:hypothetical protein